MITLEEIPGLSPAVQTVWKVRAMAIGDRNPTKTALDRWGREYPEALKTIYKVMRIAGHMRRVTNQKLVKKTTNPKHGDVYEMIAYGDVPRLFFFYEEGTDNLIICTNEYDKGGGDQDAAFKKCADLRDLYRKHKNEQKSTSRRPVR